MSEDKNFDKIFSEITSPENIGDIANEAYISDSIQYFNLIMSEFITTIQEINLIILNITENTEEPLVMPSEIIDKLQIAYEKTKEFNNSVLNLEQQNSEYFLIINEDQEDYDEHDERDDNE